MTLKHRILFGIFLLPLLTSCLGDSTANNIEQFFQIDNAAIEKVNEEQSLGLVKNEARIYQKILEPNPGGREISSKVQALSVFSLKNFSGEEILASTLEDSTIINFFENTTFPGFLAALSSLREGEKGLFYIPSPLAFQNDPIAGLDAWEPVILELEVPEIYDEEDQIDLYYKRLGKEPDTIFVDSGIKADTIIVNKEGTRVTDNSIVTLDYVGSFLSASVFDDGSLEVDLANNTLIPGFLSSIKTMRNGERAIFVFPSSLGYGDQGFGNAIPPFAPLRFEIEIVSVR